MSAIKRNNVSSIQIQNFRGISKEKKIKFSKNERFVIIHGENGTGKSSFVNAFEFLFKNKLDALDFQMKDKKLAFVHKSAKPEDLNIRLNFNDQSYFEKKFEGDVTPSNNGLKRFYRKNESFLKNASFILTRQKLLKFINDKDKNRFEAILELCGLEKLESYKRELNDVKNNFNKLYKAKEEDVNKIINTLNEVLNTNGSSFDEFVDVINPQLESLDFELIDGNTDLEDYLSTLDFSKSYKIKEKIDIFNETYEKISFEELSADFENILKGYEKLSNDSLIKLQYSVNVLDSAKEYLENIETDRCPVCNNEIDNDEILSSIDSQLNVVKNGISELSLWKNEIKEFISKLNNLNQQLDRINNCTEELDISNSFNTSWINELISQLNDFSEFRYSLIDLKNSCEFKEYQLQLDEIKNLVDERNDDLANDEYYNKIKNLRKAILDLIQLQKAQNDLDNISLKRDLSLTLLNEYKETKKEYVNEIIETIQDDVQKYYKMLHGDDLISSPKLDVVKDNSIKIYMDSFGEEADPRKYSSEGHLDSLGLCIFLAFMKEYNPLDLIILDDIITTVDFSHKYAVANLLVNEFSEFKILITTHNGLWAQQLKKVIEINGYNYDDLEIIRWDMITGPVMKKDTNHKKLIDKYVNAGEYSAAVNTSRQYLEYSTLEFCKNNTVNIKLEDKYTLYPLYAAAKPVSLKKAKERDDNNLKNAKENEEVKLEYDRLDYLWSELDKNYFIVNTLSHYNDEAFEIYSGEAKHLCELVKEICPILHSFKEKRKS